MFSNHQYKNCQRNVLYNLFVLLQLFPSFLLYNVYHIIRPTCCTWTYADFFKGNSGQCNANRWYTIVAISWWQCIYSHSRVSETDKCQVTVCIIEQRRLASQQIDDREKITRQLKWSVILSIRIVRQQLKITCSWTVTYKRSNSLTNV